MSPETPEQRKTRAELIRAGYNGDQARRMARILAPTPRQAAAAKARAAKREKKDQTNE